MFEKRELQQSFCRRTALTAALLSLLLLLGAVAGLILPQPVWAENEEKTAADYTELWPEYKETEVSSTSPAGFVYNIFEDGCIALKSYPEIKGGSYTVPAEVDGHKVVRLDNIAFLCLADQLEIPEGVIVVSNPHINDAPLNFPMGELPLKSVKLPESLRVIGQFSFLNMPNLEKIDIPDQVEEIGWRAFAACPAMKSVKLPAGLKKPLKDCFGNPEITKVILPEGLKRIEGNAFSSCEKLRRLVIPDSLEYLGNGLFFWDRFTELVLTDNNHLKYVDTEVMEKHPEVVYTDGSSYTFYAKGEDKAAYLLNDQYVQLVYITAEKLTRFYPKVDGKQIISVGRVLCDNYIDLQVPEGIEIFGEDCFSGSKITSAYFPDSVIDIGARAFADCAYLGAVKLPKHLKTIEPNTFANCTALYSVNFPDELETIGDRAFQNCYIHSVLLPDSLTTIGFSAFDGCSSLGEVKWYNLDAPAKEGTTPLIDAAAFRGCTNLTYFVFPDRFKEYDLTTFAMCSLLRSVSVPKTLEKMDSSMPIGDPNAGVKTLIFRGTKAEWDAFISRQPNRDIIEQFFEVECQPE